MKKKLPPTGPIVITHHQMYYACIMLKAMQMIAKDNGRLTRAFAYLKEQEVLNDKGEWDQRVLTQVKAFQKSHEERLDDKI